MNELFDNYHETVTQLLTDLEADLSKRSPLGNVQWAQAVTELKQDMNRMRGLGAEELGAAVSEQRARLMRLGALYFRLSGGGVVD